MRALVFWICAAGLLGCDRGDTKVTDTGSGADCPERYIDEDGDGVGGRASVSTCDVEGYADETGDCNDIDASVHPGADEVCDDKDNDCDGEIDNDPIDMREWSIDNDGDGYGAQSGTMWACGAPSNGADNADDCDDSDDSVNPAQADECDGIDNDCDGEDNGCPGFMGSADMNSATARIWASKETAYTGYSVADGGDLDGDGRHEVLVAGYNAFSSDGAVYVFAGSTSGDVYLDEKTPHIRGSDGQRLSSAMASAGDLNNDGYDDLIVGAHYGSRVEYHSGAAYVFYGPFSGTVDAEDAAVATVWGSTRHGQVGEAVDGAGDLNGDGVSDLIVGTLYEDDFDGAAYVSFGVPASGEVGDVMLKISPTTAQAVLGGTLAGLGDTDGDGLDDLIVGAANANPAAGYASAAYLFRGGFSTDLTDADADAEVHAVSIGSFGALLDGAGDADGDGLDDVLLVASDAAETRVYIFSGAISGAVTVADAVASVYGSDLDGGATVSRVPDTDGDGIDDVLVGAPGRDGGVGGAYLMLGGVSGAVSLKDAQMSLEGIVAQDFSPPMTGQGIAGVADANGDGLGDIILGAPFYAVPGRGYGAAYWWASSP